jgi:hypothetical protein
MDQPSLESGVGDGQTVMSASSQQVASLPAAVSRLKSIVSYAASNKLHQTSNNMSATPTTPRHPNASPHTFSAPLADVIRVVPAQLTTRSASAPLPHPAILTNGPRAASASIVGQFDVPPTFSTPIMPIVPSTEPEGAVSIQLIQTRLKRRLVLISTDPTFDPIRLSKKCPASHANTELSLPASISTAHPIPANGRCSADICFSPHRCHRSRSRQLHSRSPACQRSDTNA